LCRPAGETKKAQNGVKGEGGRRKGVTAMAGSLQQGAGTGQASKKTLSEQGREVTREATATISGGKSGNKGEKKRANGFRCRSDGEFLHNG